MVGTNSVGVRSGGCVADTRLYRGGLVMVHVDFIDPTEARELFEAISLYESLLIDGIEPADAGMMVAEYFRWLDDPMEPDYTALSREPRSQYRDSIEAAEAASIQ